jgi:CRP/FNR family transcriptional regulator, cyclic AMP receptor protein
MTHPSAIGQLRKIALFSGLTDQQLSAIAGRATFRSYQKGHEILSINDPSTDVFFILSGRVQVRNHSQNGREIIYSEIAPGEVLGEFAAIDGRPRSASVIAIEDTNVARMSSAEFMHVLQSDFAITLAVLRLLTAKSRGLTDRLLELSAHNTRDRVRAELVRLAQDSAQHDGPEVRIHPAPTHYEFAARIGSHREAITKELNHLATLGYIRIRRKEIVILDMEKFRGDLTPEPSA